MSWYPNKSYPWFERSRLQQYCSLPMVFADLLLAHIDKGKGVRRPSLSETISSATLSGSATSSEDSDPTIWDAFDRSPVFKDFPMSRLRAKSYDTLHLSQHPPTLPALPMSPALTTLFSDPRVDEPHTPYRRFEGIVRLLQKTRLTTAPLLVLGALILVMMISQSRISSCIDNEVAVTVLKWSINLLVVSWMAAFGSSFLNAWFVRGSYEDHNELTDRGVASTSCKPTRRYSAPCLMKQPIYGEKEGSTKLHADQGSPSKCSAEPALASDIATFGARSPTQHCISCTVMWCAVSGIICFAILIYLLLAVYIVRSSWLLDNGMLRGSELVRSHVGFEWRYWEAPIWHLLSLLA